MSRQASPDGTVSSTPRSHATTQRTSGSVRDISLLKLKDIIEDIYTSKVRYFFDVGRMDWLLEDIHVHMSFVFVERGTGVYMAVAVTARSALRTITDSSCSVVRLFVFCVTTEQVRSKVCGQPSAA